MRTVKQMAFTIQETAKLLNMSRHHVNCLLKGKILYGFKIGSDWRITRMSVESFINELSMSEHYLPLSHVSLTLNLSVKAVKELTRSKELEAVNVKGEIRVKADSLKHYLNQDKKRKALFTIPQVAGLLKVTEEKVLDLIDAGILYAAKIEGAWSVSRAALDKIAPENITCFDS